ncbi:MAG: type II toxin-antitoxin system RelB/DinJ family antitoxin [Synergistaceae bacterium]|nr:type II toxin-antitoxin system RelB/DinJ family antitoxin [Synergistaceae bacterium]
MNTAVTDELSVIEVDPELRRKAENILGKIGMSYTQAVDMFTRQIVLRNSFPVELNVPVKKPLCLEDMTEDEIDTEIQKGIDALEAGRVYTLEEAKAIMEAEYGRL